MTNPDNAVGTNAGYNGRTSTRAFNDDLAAHTRGILTGWVCSPKTAMTVELGGDGSNRDVAIAEDNAGNRTTINNTSGAPVPITLDAAPASGSRYDLIVAYAENPAQGSGSTDVDFTTQVGFIAVKGTASGTPVVPNETAIRTAITADGATGASAYYVILAQILVGTNVTTIGSGVITQGATSQIDGATIPNNAITTDKIANGAVTHTKIDFDTFDAGSRVSLSSYFTTSSGSYTATHFGFVSIQTAVYNGQSVTVNLNNNQIAKTQGAGAAGFTWIPVIVPVTKGDKVSATSSDSGNYAQITASGCYFVPIS